MSQPFRRSTRLSGTPDGAVVDARWLMKGLGIGLVAALVCGYLTLCLLFCRGQWQFVLHPPSASAEAHAADTALAARLSFEDVRFDPSDAGQPQLQGRWIPAAQAARYSAVTLLYLHGGDDSLATAMPRLAELHEAGVNLFAFDYHGYGHSAGPHPTEPIMREDTRAAWLYLTRVRKTPATHVIVYGAGVGATLAAQLLEEHRRMPAAVLENPIFDAGAEVRSDPRTALIPVRWLWKPVFDLERPLAMTTSPKLLLLNAGAQMPTAAQVAAISEPKSIVNLGGMTAEQAAAVRRESLCRFMDEYMPETALHSR